jgi:hypothetical protein
MHSAGSVAATLTAFMRILLLSVMLLMLSGAEPAFCRTRCTCLRPLQQPLEEAVPEAARAADAVFQGRVLRTESPGASLEAAARGTAWDELRVYVAVQRQWKGAPADTAVVITSSQSFMCGVDLRPGQEYLIYAGGTEAGELATSSCSRTAPLQKVKREELRLLHRLRRSGELQHSNSGGG